ncbi:MAG: NAD(P)H-hydrate dehydratase [Pseudomonadota bacterium]
MSSQQIREADHKTIQEYNIPSLTLMERAGQGLADFIAEKFSPNRGSIGILVGRGNNGGDGLVAARHLLAKNYDVAVFLLAPVHDLSPDAQANWEQLFVLKPNFYEIESVADLNNYYPHLAGCACLVDAIFGTGLSKEIKTPFREVIEFVNSLGRPIIACDLPSGLSADTGLPLGSAIKAKWTVTFGLPKIGLYLGQGSFYAGKVEIIDIGFPKQVIDSLDTKFHLLDCENFPVFFKERDINSHKGNFGHVLVLAGAENKLGAGYLASMASLRSGCGLVTYALPENSFNKFDARFPEIMPVGLPDRDRGHLHPGGLEKALEISQDKTVIALGPALGTHPETKSFILDFIKRVRKPLVIDADGLNILAENLAVIDHRLEPTVLTPHPGEMARLVGSEKVKEENRVPLALNLAAKHKCYVVLKGHNTVIATPEEEIFINQTGNPGMATAGMGDVLTGIIASLLAQGLPTTEAVLAGVYFHGLAGDIAVKQVGERGLVASDLIKALPEAMTKNE